MECFLVGAKGDQIRTTLSDLVKDLGLPVAMVSSFAELRRDRLFLDASRPLVLVPETPSNPLDVAAAVDFAKEQSGRSFVVCVADTIEPADYRQLVRTGSADWITWRACREELRELIEKVSVTPPSGRTAAVLSFVPSKGGVGNTTLLIEMAIHLSTRRKRGGARIAILDLNLQGGTVADALDLEPRFAITEIVDRPERLDEQLVDIFTSRHSKSLDVFASPKSWIDLETIRPDIVFTFIDSISSRYDAILFDLPVQWSSWTDNLLRGSDAVIVCGGESVPALRHLVATLGHLDGLAMSDGKVAAVVNPVETGLLGRVARRGVIERALAGRRTFLVRRNDSGARNALDVGRPLLELVPNSGIARDLRRLATWVETIVDRDRTPQHKPAAVRGAAA